MKISLSQITAVISNVPTTPEGAIGVIKVRVDRTTEIENERLRAANQRFWQPARYWRPRRRFMGCLQ
jgi:hypothetical protein